MARSRKPASRRPERRKVGKGWTDEVLREDLISIVAPLDEEQRDDAALCAAGLALRHPCTARRHPRRACTHPQHAEDRERLRVLLDGLGLLPEPEQTEPEPEPEPEQSTNHPALATDWSWVDWAACRGENPRLFFGPEGEQAPQKHTREEKAKAICARCPVRQQCLDRALIANEKGVWGGTAEEERSRRDRERARARARAQLQHREELAS